MTHLARRLLAALFLVSIGASGCKRTPSTSPETPQPLAEPTLSTVPVSAPEAPARGPAQPAPLPKIRVVAWNVEWFPGQKPNPEPIAEIEQMAAAKAALAEMKPDVLLLMEIRDWPSAAELVRAVPGLEVHVVSAFPPRAQNLVVASRLPADSTWSEPWKTEAVTPPRGFSFAAIELPGPRFLLVYSLHLKSNVGSFAENVPMRQASAAQLLRHSQEMLAIYGRRGPCALLLGGDMNTSLDDPKFAEERTLSALQKAGFHWTHEGVPFAERTTIPGSNNFQDNCFDHIFTAGLGRPVAFVKPFPQVSDHNPVIVDIDLAAADFQPRLEVAAGLAFLESSPVKPLASIPATAASMAGGAQAIEIADTAALLAAAGKQVKVKGKVGRVGKTGTGSIHFINFAGLPRGSFVAIVRKDHYPALGVALGGELEAVLPGREVEVTGTVEVFKDAPQIAISDPAQLKLLP